MPARIVMAWELGHGFGHVLPLATLARALIERGHDVLVVARDLVRARRAFDGLPVRLLSAPFFPGALSPAQQQNSLADVVWFDGGGHSADTLAALFLAWRELLRLLDADLLVADAAPVALAAAHGLLPTISYDNGFHCTDERGWSIFRDWERINANASQQRAVDLLTHINTARAAAGLAAAPSLAAAFAAQRTLIRFPRELDYAAPRPDARHVGQTVPPGAVPEWPKPMLPQRLFAYLRKEHPLSERVISALARLPQTEVLCFHDGLPAERLRPAPHLAYTQTPLDLAQVLPQVDAVVCHGGGLQALALQYGKPALALPLHTEQFLSARMAERAGCALLHVARGERPDFLPVIRQLLTNPSFTANAEAIAAAHRTREPDALGATLDEIDALLETRSALNSEPRAH